MDSIILKTPAKLNLFLKVLARRPDGYHQIETLFEKIALFDKIKLEKTPEGISIYSKEERLPKGNDNLAYKAAELIKKNCGISSGIRIEIEKSIPIGAGLGGGSSDAAAVLIGMNRLYDIGLSKERLESFAKELGADVPLFTSDEIWALGRERGDDLRGIDTHVKLWHILIIPPFSILSKDAYEWVDKREKTAHTDINEALSALKDNDVNLLGKNLYNDLEGISMEKLSRLKEFKSKLVEYGAKGAMISGSGPALFGIVENGKEVIDFKKRIEDEMRAKDKGWKVLIAPTLSNETMIYANVSERKSYGRI